MNGKERVLTALAHRATDRVPLDLGGRQTTLMLPAYERLKKYLGLSDLPTRVMSHRWLTAHVDEKILNHFSIDTRHVRPRNKALKDPETPHGEEETFYDNWGVGRRISGGYANLCHHPLKEAASLEEIQGHIWPDPDEEFDYTGVAQRAKQLHHEGKFAIVGCMGSPGNTLEQAWYLRGLSEFFLDMTMRKDMAHALMRRVTDHRKRNAELFLKEAGPYLDVIQVADDLGGQNTSLMSPASYREMIKPYQAELIAHIKTFTKAKVYHHSCGSIHNILEDMIDIGIEILNPVQATAAGMETQGLKKRFGDRLTFWGAVDTVKVLPYGSVDDVRREVRTRIRDLSPNGGYVLGSVHNMQIDVPPENVEAMFKTALETKI